jgi:hypothetical protein
VSFLGLRISSNRRVAALDIDNAHESGRIPRYNFGIREMKGVETTRRRRDN